MALPRFVLVKSNHNKKYLRYIKENEAAESGGAPTGFLKFSSEEAGSAYGKYELESAKSSGNKGLVHIRCCYNNKYWVSVIGTDEFENEVLIVAAADEPEEDQTKPTCTLFEPVYVDPIEEDDQVNDDDNNGDNNGDDDNNLEEASEEESQVVQFRHVQLGRYTTLHNSSEALVLSGGDDPNKVESRDVCTVVNWESVVILPKFVVFRGHEGSYLSAQITDGAQADETCLLFEEGSNFNDPSMTNEIFTRPDGTIQIKNDFFGRYWRHGNEDWIMVDAFNPTARDKNFKSTLYRAVRVWGKVIALINVGCNNYCKRYTWGRTGLAANVTNLSIFSHLHVFEPIKSRTIYNVNYRLAHARTYNYQTNIELGTGEAANFTQETTNLFVKLSYKKSSNCKWLDMRGVASMTSPTTIEARGVPRATSVDDGSKGSVKVDISRCEFKGEVQWGETETSADNVEAVCMVSVPAVSVMRVRVVASKASCEVPFSYSCRDIRTNGQVYVIDDLDDGVYSGDNHFNFKYETEGRKAVLGSIMD